MATNKQVRFLLDLLKSLGYVSHHGSFTSASKRLPYSPTMKERSRPAEEWARNLTVEQASEVISFLLEQKKAGKKVR